MSNDNRRQTIIGVLGMAVRAPQTILLTRRNAPGQILWHDKWQLPGGGLEFGESPEETVVRELEEELSVTPRILYPYPIVQTSVWENGGGNGTQVVLITYIVDIGNQRIDISSDEETGGFDWVAYPEIAGLDTLDRTQVIVDAAAEICAERTLW